MSIVLRRVMFYAVVSAALSSPLAAQAEGRWTCRADSLSGFNCAHYYNGTVTLASQLTGTNTRQTFRVVATVTGGRVSCQVTGTEVGEFSGPGMLVVAHAATLMAGGGYDISVWCPDAADSRMRRGTEPLIKVMRQRAADYTVLEGRDAHEHPDTDAANGLSGTETITWALRRP
jgi:hypothetical protein